MGPSKRTAPLCVVCEKGDPGGPIHLCLRCWDATEVRSYCSRCKGRTGRTPKRAQKLFALLQDDFLNNPPLEAGSVVHFLNRCPFCWLPGEPVLFPLRIHQLEEDTPDE